MPLLTVISIAQSMAKIYSIGVLHIRFFRIYGLFDVSAYGKD